MAGVAVNDTVLPGQVGFTPPVSAILTDGVTAAVTDMVIALEVAGLPVTPARFEVITQVTICPEISVEVV